VRAWTSVVVGAVLPLVLGVSLGSMSTDSGQGTWAHPMPPTAFLLLSLGLAVSHLLVLVGYVEVARRSAGSATVFAGVGGLGTALVAACEVWSGLLAETDLDAAVVTALEAGYGVCTVLIVVGTVGAGLVLRPTGSPFALPLLVNGLAMVVASVVRFTAPDVAV
jgi:hypothetical protein